MYCAAVGLKDWPVALLRITDLTQPWFAQFVGADVQSGKTAHRGLRELVPALRASGNF